MPAPAPAPSAAPAPAPAWPQAQNAPGDEFDEHTHLGGGGALGTPRPVGYSIELESGERFDVTGPALLGRSPRSADPRYVLLVPLNDPTVSRTHLELGVDGGWWVQDLGSTSGTVVVPQVGPPVLAEHGRRIPVSDGAVVQVGDRRLVVRAASDR